MRARGWFFTQVATFPYNPAGTVLGQATPDSCVAACCRMLLADHGLTQPEAFLRTALQVKQGAYLSDLPPVLAQFGLPLTMVYRSELTLAELRAAVNRAPAIVFVKSAVYGGHALIVDEINVRVSVRDPLPLGHGRAYRVPLTAFTDAWLRADTQCGQAVVVEE